MSLNIKEVEHLAKLARIELSEAEKKRYTDDISSILQYVNKLQEISAKGGLASCGKVKEESLVNESDDSRLREDKVIGVSSEEQKSLIKQAPETQDGLMKTKPVFE